MPASTTYHPFGMPQKSRALQTYRFGFNGKEKDPEWTGQQGSHLDFGARIYDSRIGRWTATDPLAAKYPNLGPYAFVGNMPIIAIDPDGRDIDISNLTDKNHKAALRNMLSTDEGKNFIGQFANKGDVIMGVKFKETGSRAKDLFALSSTKVNMTTRRGLTRTFLKTKSGGYGKRLKHARTVDDNVTDGVIHLVDLKIGLSAEKATNTLGHESFLHVNEDVKKLNAIDKNIENGGYSSNHRKYIIDVQNVDISGEDDHGRLIKGEATEYNTYSKQMDEVKNTNYYSKAYEQDIKNHRK